MTDWLKTPLFPRPANGVTPARRGDTRDGEHYVLSKEAHLRVNIALATGRPLLVQGEPGTGKSALAAYIARTLGWRYQEYVTTSRTEARDLLWDYRTLERLNDAQQQNRKARKRSAYVEPQALWWAMAPTRAAYYGGKTRTHPFDTRAGKEPPWKLEEARDVVLIDEIDKADPQVPNDLLVTIGSLRFTVAETGDEIRCEADRTPFLIFTTNAERDLPRAFVRRCIPVVLSTPTGAVLADIGAKHFPGLDPTLRQKVADRIDALRAEAESARVRAPSIAEYLDTLAACQQFGVRPGTPGWKALTLATMWKAPNPPRDG